MRTTLDLPESLIKEAMKLTNSKTKSDTIRKALKWLVQYEKRKKLIQFRGKVDLDLDLDALRDRS